KGTLIVHLEKHPLALVMVKVDNAYYWNDHQDVVILHIPIFHHPNHGRDYRDYDNKRNGYESSGRTLVLGWHLEEMHMTWAQFGMKRDKIATLHDKGLKNYFQEAQLVGNEVVRVKIPKCISWLDDEPIGNLDTMEDNVDNPSPQSTPQVLLSFKVYTPPVTYQKQVEVTIGIPMEVEPLNEIQLDDLGLNTCNHDIPLSSRDVPSFDESDPQPQPLPSCPSLDVSLGHERGPKLPIKPHSPDSLRMKMATAAQNTNNTTIRSILQQEKLVGPNFTKWFQNLRIVLRSEGKLAHLEQPLIPLPYPVASQVAHDAYEALYDVQNEVACLMLGSMSPNLQRTLKNYKAYDMIQELKTMFKEQAKQELYETVKAFYACKQKDGQSVSSRLLKMKSYLDTLERLGYAMPNELGMSLILNFLNKYYDQFVRNYNMHNMGKTLAELHVILKLHEKSKEVDHWRRNCQSYHVELKKRKNTSVASTLESRKLKQGALSLYMGNGMRVVVEAIGSFDLILPS
ncbi:hypothetical protein Tco_0937926, partial [Tanacetum coccineum]